MSTLEIILAAAVAVETGLGVWLYTLNVKLGKQVGDLIQKLLVTEAELIRVNKTNSPKTANKTKRYNRKPKN